MTKKKLMITILSFLISLSMTGCWDRNELINVGIVSAIGLDKDVDTGKVSLTCQVIRPSALVRQGSGGKDSPYELVTTSGKTIYEAIENTSKQFDRTNLFSHIKVIIVSESFARDGINDIIDFIVRSHEVRRSTWLVISPDKIPDILSIKRGLNKIQASYLEQIMIAQKSNMTASASNAIDLIQKITGEGIHPFTGVLKKIDSESIDPDSTELKEKEGLLLSGTAVFKKDKLAGFLNEAETFGLNTINAKKKSTFINVPSPIKNSELSIEIKKIKSEIKPVIKGKNILFDIDIRAEGNISEISSNLDLLDQTTLAKINTNFSLMLKEEVSVAVTKIQKELQTDILGFGSTLYRKYPKYWNSIKDEWDNIFPNVSYSVKVDTKINRTGLVLKPINSK